MCDAEALLLVDNEQTEISELDVLLEDSVGGDDDVDLARGETFESGLALLGRAETREHVEADRVALEAILEILVVLLAEDGRRCEDHHLFPVQGCAQGGSNRDLRLAVADVPADEPIHGLALLHISQHIVDRRHLVGRLFVGEGGLEFLHRHIATLEREARCQLPCGMEREQLARHVA